MNGWRGYNWYQMADLFEELGLEVREGESRTEMKKRLLAGLGGEGDVVFSAFLSTIWTYCFMHY